MKIGDEVYYHGSLHGIIKRSNYVIFGVSSTFFGLVKKYHLRNRKGNSEQYNVSSDDIAPMY